MERFLSASKTSQSASNEKTNNAGFRETELGRMNLLGVETEIFHEHLVLSHSPKTRIFNSIYGNDSNPYTMIPGEIISVNYEHNDKYYQMSTKVMETSKHKQIVQPLELPVQQSGLKLKLINYSPGGIFIEGNRELIQLLFAKNSFQNRALMDQQLLDFNERAIQQAIGQPIFHLTFFPRLKFPKSLHRFEPRIPFKICLLAQIVAGRLLKIDHQQTLQLNIQFCYELDHNAEWRQIRNLKSNTHFKTISEHIRSLIRYIDDYEP
ncbi:MAG: hypothetical protein VX294_07950 [Candidatus Latescibacterota bacterium]|nr:hypothetical protein [Candidatus Latescibacterota bacterium]